MPILLLILDPSSPTGRSLPDPSVPRLFLAFSFARPFCPAPTLALGCLLQLGHGGITGNAVPLAVTLPSLPSASFLFKFQFLEFPPHAALRTSYRTMIAGPCATTVYALRASPSASPSSTATSAKSANVGAPARLDAASTDFIHRDRCANRRRIERTRFLSKNRVKHERARAHAPLRGRRCHGSHVATASNALLPRLPRHSRPC